MTQPEILSALVRIIRPYTDSGRKDGVKLESLTGSEHMKNDLNVDSADVVEIVLDIESEFGITIEDSSIAGLTTVNDMVALIAEKQMAKA